jgi:SAM-dependent methyltransferase
MIGDALRGARTLALRLASPAEAAVRRAAGRPELPPLWLRRHTGPLSNWESAARETADLLDRFGLASGGSVVLDAGCGAGAMVPQLLERIGRGGRYVGFDVHAPSIRWCAARYANDPRLGFHVADVASPYGGRRAQGAPYRFPIGDGEADLVLAKSLFTHLFEDEASRYLRETRRALRPGKAAVVTAFLYDPERVEELAVRRAFPHADASGAVRWRSRLRPSAAVAYAKPRFVEMIESAGLRVQWHWPGYFPGSGRPTGQDTILLGH